MPATKKKNEEEIKFDSLSIKSQVQKIVAAGDRSRTIVELKPEPFAIIKTELVSDRGNNTKEPAVAGGKKAGWPALLIHGSSVLDTKASHKNYLSEDWINKYK